MVRKAELVCDLCGVENIAIVLQLQLTGGALAVFQQLSKEERKDVGCIRNAMYVVFATDPFVAYDLFVARRLNANESVDVYLADLRRLVNLVRRGV